jgi:hypothetical protein
VGAVQRRQADQALVLHVAFEPISLSDVLDWQNFAHWTAAASDAKWMVWFYGEATRPRSAAPASDANPRTSRHTVVLNVRASSRHSRCSPSSMRSSGAARPPV